MPNDRTALRRALDAYAPRSEQEHVDVQRIRAATDDVFERTAPLHVTASAFVVHPPTRRVLLRWHDKVQRWMQVGGHFDPGETDPLAVAHREACEETGLTDLTPQGTEPLQVVIVPVPEHGPEPAHEHADLRYVFTTTDPDAVRAESESTPLRWTPIEHATIEVVEPNLRVFLERIAARE